MAFQYMLAPLEKNSDNALRTLCYRHGADLTFTEMTWVDPLSRNNKVAWSRLECNDDTPTAFQILVGKETQLETFLKKFTPPACFKGFNLNLGCPSQDKIKLGLGCVMMKRTTKVSKFVDILKKYDYPVSLKIRLGANAFEKQKKVYLNVLNNIDADYFIVHARHGTEKYIQPADFSIYQECVDTGKTIVANGDIAKKEQIRFLTSLGVKGAMIGRAAVENPAIFDMLKGNKTPSLEELKQEYEALAQKYTSKEDYVTNVLSRMGRKRAASAEKLE